MSHNKLHIDNETIEHLIDDSCIVDYLQNHPDFFQHHPQLLASLKLPSKQQGAISLVERQHQIMRDKIHTLEDEITALMSIASHNQKLYQQFSALNVKLLECSTITELCATMVTSFELHLGLTQVAIKLFKPNVPVELHCQRSELDNMLIQRLDRTQCYFGRLNQQEQTLVFGQQFSGSVALISLGKYSEVGLLAVASDDPNHFEPNMDNLMLMQLCRLFAGLIDNLDA